MLEKLSVSKLSPKPVILTIDEIDGIRDVYEDSQAVNTRRTYTKAFGYFAAWVGRKGGDILPSAPETVAAYYKHLAIDGKSVATIRTYSAAIAAAHKDKGVEDPTSHFVCKKVLSGIGKKAKNANRGEQKQARGMIADEVALILESLGDSLTDLRTKAMLCVARSGLCRRSELVGLSFDDYDHVECIISIYREKTGTVTQAALTPAACQTLNEWMNALEGQGVSSGALFRRIDRHGNVLKRF